MALDSNRTKIQRITGEAYETERLSELVTSAVRMLMDKNGIRNAELATRLGVSEARVSQMLSRGTNLTLRSLAALSNALGASFEIGLAPRAYPRDTHVVEGEIDVDLIHDDFSAPHERWR